MQPRFIDYCYIFATIFFTVYGQLIIKWRVSHLEKNPTDQLNTLTDSFYLLFDPIIFSGIFAAFLASISWLSAISKFEISYAYPFIALNFIFVILLGAFLLNESLTAFKVIGMSLIVAGVFFTSRT